MLKSYKLGTTPIFKMDHFKKYSHSRHILFLSGDLSLNSSSKLYQAYEWESPLAKREEDLLRKKRSESKNEKYTGEELWKEIIQELYLHEGAESE